jgi:hypothetical protein
LFGEEESDSTILIGSNSSMHPTGTQREQEQIRSVLKILDSPDRSWDQLLKELLQVLTSRGMARKWSTSSTPYADLDRECQTVGSQPETAAAFAQYLSANPVIQLSVQSFLAHLSVAANIRPEHVPSPQQILTPLGSRIARWLPTFLVIDGPLGRFLRAGDSPLNELLRSEHSRFPSLAQARDTFNHDLFRRVRNGVGHWAFACEHDETGERLVCYDWESGERTAEISLLEAEALHIVSFSVIECFNKRFFSP